MTTTATKGACLLGERLHRALLAVVFLIALSCLFLTYVAIDRYIETGRSFYGDVKTSIGYQWKGDSCDRLFQDISPSPAPPSFRNPSSELCTIARRHYVPPLALKATLDEARSAHRDSPSSARSDLDNSLAVLADARANLIGQLPGLEQRYRRLQREVLCMWLFFPG